MDFLKNIESALWLLAHSDEPNDRREWAVLYWKFHGLTHQQVADKLHYSKEWVQRYMTSAHRRFGTPDELESLEKFEWLQENVFPTIKKFLDDNPDTLKELPPPPGEPIPPPPPPGPNREIKPYVPKPIKPIIIPPNGKRTRPDYLVLAVICALVIVVGGVAYWIGSRGVSPLAPVNTLQSPESPALNSTLTLPSPSLETTFTFTLEPTLTLTIPPTNTSTLTPTITVTPYPQGYVFFDDFENGLDSSWSVVYGNPIVVNEKLTATEPSMLSIGSPFWKNYQVEFDVEPVPGYLASGVDAIGIRVVDKDNMLFYIFANFGSAWFYIENGESTRISNADTGNVRGPIYLIIRVEGDKVTVHNRSSLLMSFNDDTFPNGQIFLRIFEGSQYDNFKITLLD